MKDLRLFPAAWLWSIMAALLLAACAGQSPAEPSPPVIHYGQDACEFCGMIVSEERFAAGYLTEDGQEFIFDDIGDMVQAQLKSPSPITAIFVHDYDHHTWIRAETAYFMMSDKLPTPMISGVAAFPSAEAAQTLATEYGGQVYTFEELLSHYQENSSTAGMSDMPGH
jgi:copper chaperone NosL